MKAWLQVLAVTAAAAAVDAFKGSLTGVPLTTNTLKTAGLSAAITAGMAALLFVVQSPFKKAQAIPAPAPAPELPAAAPAPQSGPFGPPLRRSKLPPEDTFPEDKFPRSRAF